MLDDNAPIKSFEDEYDWLSNFYKNGNAPTVEHLYQADKTLDKKWKQKIMSAPKPGKAKRLGKKAPLRPGWDSERLEVMHKFVKAKFQDPILQDLLIKTYPRTLIEGNYWHDNFFGDCYCEDCKNKEGLNMLGFILTRVRSELINGG
jgi:ribA/ribD-fused uncharacterized protein